MFNKLKYIVDNKMSSGLLWLSAITTFVLSKIIQIFWLDKSYVASKFPVPFYEGQTTFDAQVTKGHFQVLIDEGTLNIFWNTQFIDFAYLAMTFICTALFMLALYKMFNPNGGSFANKMKNFAWIMVFIMPFNAVMDALENLVSFVMLSNPSGFSDWLIYPYSTFAVLKFALYGVGYLWIILALVIALGIKGYSLATTPKLQHN